jgi:hypothetical protein
MLPHLADARAFKAYLGPLWTTDWFVYAKRPFAGPEQVLAYCPATPTASPSPIAAWSQPMCRASHLHTATKAAPPGQEIAWLATVIGAISAAGVGVAVVLAGA